MCLALATEVSVGIFILIAGMHRTLGDPDTLSRLICADSEASLSEDMLKR